MLSVLLAATTETDEIFPAEKRHASEVILKEVKQQRYAMESALPRHALGLASTREWF